MHRTGDGGIPEGVFDAVKQDIIDMVLTDSKDFFPADVESVNSWLKLWAFHDSFGMALLRILP
jgi:hypothetical protein